MTEVVDTSVPFWPEQKVCEYGSAVPLLFKLGNQYLDRNWPDNGPDQDDVIEQLKNARKGWVNAFKPKNQDSVKITFLVGKYKVTVNVGQSDGKPRLWLGRIYFANNQDRQRMLEQGALLSFDGLQLLTGSQFGHGLESREQRFSSGLYVNELLDIINSPWGVDGEEVVQEEQEEDELSFEERDMIDALRSFIDSEYALEQISAQQCLPFSATSVTARSQKTTYRLHYEIILDRDDYSRLLELQPSLLVVLSELQEPTDILLEVTELAPIENEPVIYVSIEKQTSDVLIPSEVMLGIAALPTLKKVRNAVVDSLESLSSKNPWLLPIASGTYEHAPLKPVDVPLPPSKFPPTPSQVKAINSGAGSDDYTLVLGPPGTGKTTVILQWVKYFAALGKRVLVTSQNNKAVDNVLERLAEEDEFECLRIGNENKISSSLESITLDNKAAELQANMFEQAGQTIDQLKAQQRLVEELIQNRDSISSLIVNRDKLSRDHQLLFEQIQIMKSEMSVLTSEQITVDDDLLGLQRELKALDEKEWPIFKFISRLINAQRAKSINKRIAEATHRTATIRGNIDASRNKVAELESVRVGLPPQIDELNQTIAPYFKSAQTLVNELPIPGSGSRTASLTEIEALDALLDRLSELIDNLATWFEKLRQERQQALYKILIENVNVVGATCIGINTKALFRELDFDVVIVDESGQIQLHNLIVPLSRASKAILVGDHKQLPPVVSDEVLEEIRAQGFDCYQDLYRLSWFEHLWNAAPQDRKIMLDTQFRCPSIISDFVSDAFYEGKYFAGVGMDKKKPLLSFCPQPMVWIDTCRLADKQEKATNQDGRAVVQDNVCETRLVINLLKKAIKELPELAEKREIGIIVPYANHVKAIQKAIRQQQRRGQLTELQMPLNELVASVDSFQGQERDLIIFTFTRSNPRGKVGFLSDWRRLNVAQTRAKKQLIMIGDSQTLTKGANREGAHDVEFKKAMCLLKEQTREKGGLLNAARFVNKPSAQRRSGNKSQQQRNKQNRKVLVGENG